MSGFNGTIEPESPQRVRGLLHNLARLYHIGLEGQGLAKILAGKGNHQGESVVGEEKGTQHEGAVSFEVRGFIGVPVRWGEI